MSAIVADGSPATTTRSACLPRAMLPTPAREGLEDGQRRGQRDVAVDELLHERLERRAVLVDRGHRLLAARLAWAHIRLLVGDEIGCGKKSVLQVVDAEVRRFAEGDR